jgi:arsenate reductase
MAVGFVNTLFPEQYRAAGAGIDPKEIDPLTIEVMGELGIDLSSYPSLRAGQISDTPSDFVVTLCDNAVKICPLFPYGNMSFHKSLSDPSSSFPEDRDARLKSFRKLRDEIKEWVEKTFQG